MERYILIAMILAAIAFGVMAVVYSHGGEWERESRIGGGVFWVLTALVLIGIVGFQGHDYLLRWRLLDACTEKERIVREREFTCTIPVTIRIRDGWADGFGLPKAQEKE